MDNYKSKYLKYKLKYEKLNSKQYGGSNQTLEEQPSIGTYYMIISAHGVLLDDDIDNINSQIHFACPEGTVAYLDVSTTNDIEFREEHGLPSLPLRKQLVDEKNTVSNYKKYVSFPGKKIRNIGFGLEHTLNEIGPDESVYIYNDDKHFVLKMDLREEERSGATAEFFTLKYMLDMFIGDYGGGIVLVSACRGPSEADKQKEKDEEFNNINWDESD
jgi:hypothetical protein